MEENKYKAALERAKSAIKECGGNVGRIKMIESIFPELAESKEENIRKSILMMFKKALPDVFNRYGMNKNDAIAYMEKLKDIDKRLEDAYKTADEVQYKRGYDDGYLEGIGNAKKELEKQGEQEQLTHSQVTKKSEHEGVEQGKREMLENALDAYCKVCSNYGSPTPLNICRQECKNYSDFKKVVEDKEL